MPGTTERPAGSTPTPTTDDGTRRLDVELVRRGLARSRGQARELIEAGAVLVDGKPGKPSAPVSERSDILLTAEPDRWVGRAAYKLLEALRTFAAQGLTVDDRRCLDVGASTGGFTQVLLEAGASEVVALDVGHDQLVAQIADDERVVERSGTNIRQVAAGDLGPPFDVVVADLSFISLRTVLPAISAQLRAGGDLVALVKPQFEVGRERLSRTGVVGSPQERRRAVSGVIEEAQRLDLDILGLVSSPIRGAEGNHEYLVWARSPQVSGSPISGPVPVTGAELETLVNTVTAGEAHKAPQPRQHHPQ